MSCVMSINVHGQTVTNLSSDSIVKMNNALLALAFLLVLTVLVPSVVSDGYGHGHGYGHSSHGIGTACIVKGSYCQCHYCKCEHGHIHCKGHGHGGGYGKS